MFLSDDHQHTLHLAVLYHTGPAVYATTAECCITSVGSNEQCRSADMGQRTSLQSLC